jgi:hypothetical protein
VLAQIEEMDERHLKLTRAIQGRALEALSKTALRTSAEAVRALDVAMSQERSIRDRQARGHAIARPPDSMRVDLDRELIDEARDEL